MVCCSKCQIYVIVCFAVLFLFHSNICDARSKYIQNVNDATGTKTNNLGADSPENEPENGIRPNSSPKTGKDQKFSETDSRPSQIFGKKKKVGSSDVEINKSVNENSEKSKLQKSKLDSILPSLYLSTCQRESKTFLACKSKSESQETIEKDNPISSSVASDFDPKTGSDGVNNPTSKMFNNNDNFFDHYNADVDPQSLSNNDGGGIVKVDKDGKISKDEILIVSDSNMVVVDEFENNNEEEFISSQSYDFGQELPDCTEKLSGDWTRSPLLIVSTLDGHITGLDYENGAVLWSHKTGNGGDPMLSSSMSKLEVTSRGEWVRLIPSLDGGIYRFDGESVEALPITADTLLHSSFKFNEDTMFTGGKVSEVIGIATSTGEIKYICDNTGCPRKQSTATSNQILVVKRVSQTVRAIDPKTGNERWNFSVGQHEVNIANGGCESLFADLDPHHTLPSFHFVLPEGMVIAVGENSEVIWKQKLSSPVVSAWGLVRGELDQIDLFSSNSVPALLPEKMKENDTPTSEELNNHNRQAALYVGIHQRQLYIQQNKKMQKDSSSVGHFIAKADNGNEDTSFPRVQWLPYLATALSRTPVVHHGTRNHPLLLDYDKKQQSTDLVIRHNLDYPFDNGYYLFGDEEGALINESDYWHSILNEDDLFDDLDSETTLNKIYHICFQAGPSTWLMFGGGVALYAALHVLYVKYLIKNIVNDVRRELNAKAIAMILGVLQKIFREHPQVFAIIQRLGLRIPPLLPPPPLDPKDDHRNQLEGPQRQDSNFSSRYTSDFEPMRCLGKGGFGVVFQVKNKLDENEYAVKRIVLPSKLNSAERMKREVKALAKLDHSNIVRYYASWLETPPVGWEQEADSWWRESEAVSNSFISPDIEDTEDVKATKEPNKLSCDDQSLSAVLKKLNKNFDKQENKNIYNNDASCGPEFKLNIDCDDSEEESDNDSVTGYEEDNEGECSSDESSDKSDNSFEVVFEDPGENGVALHRLTPKDTTENEDSVVFADDDCERQLSISNDLLTGNNYGKYTCKTISTSRSDSVSFKENLFGNRSTYKNRTKSSSFSAPSEYTKEKIMKRRRVKSHGLSKEQCERPSFLNLVSSHSDPFDSFKSAKQNQVVDNNKIPPNPRTYLYIQMELCQKESLKDWLSANSKRDLSKLYTIFNDIVLAVEYVHDRALMHRDLKPSNIFFSLDGKIKIGDFGLVTTIEEEENVVLTPMNSSNGIANTDVNNIQQKQRTVNAGTYLYMSPEQINGKSYNYKIDIFSLGLIFFEMIVPFCTEMERREVISKARNRNFPKDFANQFPNELALLQLALHPNPSERPTTRGIRTREPLVQFQKDLNSIHPDEHFTLTRTKSHSRSYSGSFSGFVTSSTSS